MAWKLGERQRFAAHVFCMNKSHFHRFGSNARHLVSVNMRMEQRVEMLSLVVSHKSIPFPFKPIEEKTKSDYRKRIPLIQRM